MACICSAPVHLLRIRIHSACSEAGCGTGMWSPNVVSLRFFTIRHIHLVRHTQSVTIRSGVCGLDHLGNHRVTLTCARVICNLMRTYLSQDVHPHNGHRRVGDPTRPTRHDRTPSMPSRADSLFIAHLCYNALASMPLGPILHSRFHKC